MRYRPFGRTGLQVSAVGFGCWPMAGDRYGAIEDDQAVQAIHRALDRGVNCVDTAPAYGASEEVAGRIAQELGIAGKLFWATKLNVAGWGGGAADPAAAREQLETSFMRIGRKAIDLVQVHNLGDLRTQLPILREYKAQGRVRYVGVTTTIERQYDVLVQLMKREPLDFIGTDYAIDERGAEQTILPVARERGIAVLVYAPFGRTRLWQRVKGREVPPWAREFGASSWAQFFLKFVASHPAVTAITPATSRPANMADNMGAALGELPDAAMRKRMIELVEGLP